MIFGFFINKITNLVMQKLTNNQKLQDFIDQHIQNILLKSSTINAMQPMVEQILKNILKNSNNPQIDQHSVATANAADENISSTSGTDKNNPTENSPQDNTSDAK